MYVRTENTPYTDHMFSVRPQGSENMKSTDALGDERLNVH